MWLNTLLVHDIYLKSIKAHLSMIDCEKLSCKIFLFFVNKLPQVATLVGVVDVSTLVLYHVKTSMWWSLIWFCDWLLNVFILCLNTLCCRTWYQSEVWRYSPIVHWDLEAMLLHLRFLLFMYIFSIRGLFHCIHSDSLS